MSILSGCQTIHITNDALYFPFGSNAGAVEEHVLDSTTIILTEPQFNAVLDAQPMVCMTATAYSNIKGNYEKFCGYEPQLCDYQTQTAANAFFLKTSAVLKFQNKMFNKLH